MRVIARWFWAPAKASENSVQTGARILGNISRSAVTIVFILSAGFVATQMDKVEQALVAAGWLTPDYEKLIVQVTYLNENAEYLKVRPILEARELALSAPVEPLDETWGKYRFESGLSEALFLQHVIPAIQNPSTTQILCTNDYPIVVYVENRSNKTLMNMRLELEAREPGSSLNKLSGRDSYFYWNTILPDGHAYTMCLRNEKISPTDRLSALPTKWSVKFQPTESWMHSEAHSWVIKK